MAEIPAADDDNAILDEEGEADISGIVRTPGEETKPSKLELQLESLLSEGPIR